MKPLYTELGVNDLFALALKDINQAGKCYTEIYDRLGDARFWKAISSRKIPRPLVKGLMRRVGWKSPVPPRAPRVTPSAADIALRALRGWETFADEDKAAVVAVVSDNTTLDSYEPSPLTMARQPVTATSQQVVSWLNHANPSDVREMLVEGFLTLPPAAQTAALAELRDIVLTRVPEGAE